MDIPNSSEIDSKEFTQKDLMQFLLHSTQHAATREELEGVKKELKDDISKLEVNLKADISKLEVNLKADISNLKTDNLGLANRMDKFMIWSLGFTITSTFAILGFIYKLMERLPVT